MDGDTISNEDTIVDVDELEATHILIAISGSLEKGGEGAAEGVGGCILEIYNFGCVRPVCFFIII